MAEMDIMVQPMVDLVAVLLVAAQMELAAAADTPVDMALVGLMLLLEEAHIIQVKISLMKQEDMNGKVMVLLVLNYYVKRSLSLRYTKNLELILGEVIHIQWVELIQTLRA